jgi:hypothetical protein
MHFAMKLFLAAPWSGLPSALTALIPQASRLHFFTKLILAAPWSGLPFALTAWLSHDCAAAVPTARQVINAVTIMCLINLSSIYNGRVLPADQTEDFDLHRVISKKR